MIFEYITGTKCSALAQRLACLLFVENKKIIPATLGQELKDEIQQVTLKLDSLPPDLSLVIAWETLLK